jgi:phage internal scaffolding protein
MMENVFRTPYDGVDKRVRLEFCDDEGNTYEDGYVGKTEQSHKSMCEVENILRQYDRTGLITHVNNAVAQYGDYTEINEYQDNLNMVIEAQNAFDELPSHIRKKFGNDPGLFFEFATNPENKDELIELGLANAPVVVEPQEVKIVADATNTTEPTA